MDVDPRTGSAGDPLLFYRHSIYYCDIFLFSACVLISFKFDLL